MRYTPTKQFILTKLEAELPEILYYHSVAHVLDVLAAADMIAEHENISEGDQELLRVAVLFHDAGFLENAGDHENYSCVLAREKLPEFGYSEEEINIICGMIIATRIPQTPQTHLEQIICDADLDYLGRDDFFMIGDSLMKELHVDGRVNNIAEWNLIQEKFISAHDYFTATSKALRQKKKEENLLKVKQLNNLQE